MPENNKELYWLHVPLTATRGSLLGADRSHVSVLGKRAQLLTREFSPQLHGAVSATVVDQWLLFDPMEKADAEALLDELRAKLPALSLRMRASFRIDPRHHLTTSVGETYNGPMPTLIPADQKPRPVWIDSSMSREQVGWEDWLDTCPPVRDERLIAALSLYVSASDEMLPRSQFLTYLTILDSLATQWPRDAVAVAWIDDKLKEPVAVNDGPLSSALANLKEVSHGTAVRELVNRAAMAQGLASAEVKLLTKSAGELYRVRSDLSHAGNLATPNVSAARKLAELVLEQAIQHPAILDALPFRPESTASA